MLPPRPRPPAPRRSGFWTIVKESVRGEVHHDFTEGPIGRAILLLAVPMVLEVVLESVFAVADIFWVSRLGPDAVAAVGLTESLLTVVYALAMGLGIGATALVARRIGEKDPEGAARAAVQALVLALLVSVVLGVAGALLAPRLLALMGGIAVGDRDRPRLRHDHAGRRGGHHRAVRGQRHLPRRGRRGDRDARALAGEHHQHRARARCSSSASGRSPSSASPARRSRRRSAARSARSTPWCGSSATASRVPVGAAAPRARPRRDGGRCSRLSGSATLQNLIGMASWIGLVRILAGFGSDALAGYTIAVRLIIFALLPSWGLSNAAATMVGQGLGARKPERAETSVWRAGRLQRRLPHGAWALFFVLAAPLILRAFTSDPAVTDYAVHCLRIVALGFPFYAYGMVLTQSFNGAGDTWTPTWLNLFCFWVFEIPLAWLLAHPAGLGPSGVFWAIMAAFSLLALASALVFRRGKWKTRVV